MPFVSSVTLLRTLSVFHLSIAYLLLTSPSTLAEQNLVHVLGTALHLPRVSSPLPSHLAHPASSSFTSPGTPALGLAAVFLAFLALSDLAALSMSEEVHVSYWTAQTPTRLAALFAFEAWLYLTKPGIGQVATGMFKGLMNDVVFAWGFVELLATFWTFMILRDEKKDFTLRKAQKARLELEKD